MSELVRELKVSERIAGKFDISYNEGGRYEFSNAFNFVAKNIKYTGNRNMHISYIKVKQNIIKKVSLLVLFTVCIAFCTGCKNIIPYSVEQQRTEYDASLYSFANQLSDLENIVCAMRYDEDEILLYEELLEDNLLHKKVWLFSYLTGEKKLCSEHTVTVKRNYQVTNERFCVYSSNPLVMMDTYADEIYIYTDDLSACSTIDMERKETGLEAYACESGLFFMDTFTYKVYHNTLEEFRAEPKEMSFKAFCNASKTVLEPDINMTSCTLVTASDDGKMLRLYAQSLIDKEYYYFDYDIEKGEYAEVYDLSEDGGYLWQSWDYAQHVRKVIPSAVPRFAYADSVAKKEYSCKIEAENVYSYVVFDETYPLGKNDLQPEMPLFCVVDEKEERIVDVLLWDYQNAESDKLSECIEKLPSPYPKEIDYDQLTAKAERLEEQYGINIVMGENVVCDFDAYDYRQVTDEERMNLALEELETALGVFPEGMCAEMTEDYALGFNIYFCGSFTPKNDDNISDAGAFFIYDNGYYNLALNIMQDNTEANVVHEMTHALDVYFGFVEVLDNLDEDWAACNPEEFEYLHSYFDYEEEYEYTYYDVYDSIDDIYFCDTYAKTFPGEDRSRVFEYFGASLYDGDAILESVSLQKKAGLLLDYCEEHLACFREDEEYGLKMKAEEFGF
ncbi:MAG: hypothetical protein E7289_10360 [Lachnospiraceae bacterium]|nr:hypothetical protein [Lachnospiraceae bacterium]